MGRSSLTMAVGWLSIALLLVMSCGMVVGAANSPPPAPDCSIPFNNLMPCIDFVNSNSSGPPSAPCCTAFSTTQKLNPVCLCQLQQAFADPATAPGNATRASEIPSLCKVPVDYNKCPGLLGLAPAPSPTTYTPAHPPVSTPRHAPMSAPVPAPGPAPPKGSDYDCSNSFNELSSCLGFVSGDGKGGPPKECCYAIGNVQAREPICLCQLLAQVNDSAQYGVNVTLAQSLPQLCHVVADTSRCPALLNSPITSAPSPSFSPTSPVHSPPPSSIVPIPAHAPVPPPSYPSLSPSPVSPPPPPATPAPGPVGESVDCSNEYALLQSCFTYVMANDTSPPSTECCSSLATVVTNKPVCLCQLLQTVGSGDPAVAGINATRALGLPNVCKVVTDVGLCPALLGQPVSSPLPSSPLPGTSPTPSDDTPNSDGSVGEAPAPSLSCSSSVRPALVVRVLSVVLSSFVLVMHVATHC